MTSHIVCLLLMVVDVSAVGTTIPPPQPAPGAQPPQPAPGTLADYKAAKAQKVVDEAAQAAREAKMGAVNKVISLLATLKKGVQEEGESEEKSYLEFTRFCGTMSEKKGAAISTEADAVDAAQAAINALVVGQGTLASSITTNDAEIKRVAGLIAASKTANEEGFALFEKNAADLLGALHGVGEAIKVMKAGNPATLLQVQSMSQTVESALMLADAMGLTSAGQSGALLQKSGPEMENYKSHSTGIITMLETLQEQFRVAKSTVDTQEAARLASFKTMQQMFSDSTKVETKNLEDNKESMDRKAAEEAMQTQILKVESDNLADDRQFLSDLSAGCTAKKNTNDQRTALRTNELRTIEEATTIIKTTVASKTGSATVRLAQVASSLHIASAVAHDEQAMEALEEEAESTEAGTAIGFLQKRRSATKLHSPDSRQAVASLLKKKGMQLHSAALLNLVGQISADPLAKVKKLIQELVERLLAEASSEANQKGFCDKAQGDASQKLEYASEKVADLTAELAKLNAEQERLTQDLTSLNKEKTELQGASQKADEMKTAETTRNSLIVGEAQQGKDAVDEAVTLISRFYASSAKEAVSVDSAALLQVEPFANGPDAVVKNNDAYKGAAEESGGIVAMMEVISADFARTVQSTKASEAKAVSEHRAFMTETLSSIAEKTQVIGADNKFKDEVETQITDDDGSLTTQEALVVTSKKELADLKPVCQPKGQTAAERKAMRQDEIDSLKNALTIFEDMELPR